MHPNIKDSVCRFWASDYFTCYNASEFQSESREIHQPLWVRYEGSDKEERSLSVEINGLRACMKTTQLYISATQTNPQYTDAPWLAGLDTVGLIHTIT